jgi:hypothetical protein
VADQAGERQLIDLAKSQLAFARVIGPSLYAGIEFSVHDMPAPVVADGQTRNSRHRSDAVIRATDRQRWRRSNLADAVEAEGSVAKVALLFRLLQHSVRAALRFEKRLADRLAA